MVPSHLGACVMEVVLYGAARFGCVELSSLPPPISMGFGLNCRHTWCSGFTTIERPQGTPSEAANEPLVDDAFAKFIDF